MTELLRALRGLRRAPAFGLAVLLLIVLATGANTAIFTVARGVLIDPVPWPSPDRLVVVWETGPGDYGDAIGVGLPDFFDWRRDERAFSELGAYASAGFNLATGGEADYVEGGIASANLLRLLGAEPALGRHFLPEEEEPGGGRPVILGHELWMRRFGGDAGILGRAVDVSGEPRIVVGVLPAGFRGPIEAELWVPLGHYAAPMREWRTAHPLFVLGRLADGVSLPTAERRLAARAQAIWTAEAGAVRWDGWSVRLVPLNDELLGSYRRTVTVLWGAVAVVLLVAAANLVNLFLTRLAVRRRELAVRGALGAGPGRIFAAIAAEALVLTACGAAGGLLVAQRGIAAIQALLPPQLVHLAAPRVDRAALGYSLLLSAFLVLLALAGSGAWQGLVGLGDSLAAHVRTTRRPSRLLVAAQFALTLPLLAAAMLLLASTRNLRQIDPGVATREALTFRTALPAATYASPEARRLFFERLGGRLERLPGVAAVAWGSNVPLSRLGTFTGTSVFVHGRPRDGGEAWASGDVRVVSPGYFEALGMRLVRGRLLAPADDAGARVAVVNETMAAATWPGEDPLGQRILDGNEPPGFDFEDPAAWYTVVGVVADARSGGLRAAPVPEVYLPFAKRPGRAMTFVVRPAAGEAGALLPAVLREVVATDPTQPIFQVLTLDQLADESIARERLALWLLAALCALALVMAAVGVFGVVSHSVTSGLRELGVRSSLGARGVDLLRLVLARSAALALAGSAVGLVVAAVAGRSLAGLLYGVDPADARTLSAAAAGALAVALLGALPPALRAARVDPAIVLREE